MTKKNSTSDTLYLVAAIVVAVVFLAKMCQTMHEAPTRSYNDEEQEVLDRYYRDTEDPLPMTKADRM